MILELSLRKESFTNHTTEEKDSEVVIKKIPHQHIECGNTPATLAQR